MRDVEVNAGEAPPTRLIAMGRSGLTEGLALIGFETIADATAADVEQLLNELLQRRERALVLLEPYLARCDCKALQRIRSEGGRIVVTEAPPLHAPGNYHPMIEDLVLSVLGPTALEEST